MGLRSSVYFIVLLDMFKISISNITKKAIYEESFRSTVGIFFFAENESSLETRLLPFQKTSKNVSVSMIFNANRLHLLISLRQQLTYLGIADKIIAINSWFDQRHYAH